MEVKLKDGIYISGHSSTDEIPYYEFVKGATPVIYAGLIAEIPEDIAKDCVEHFIGRCKYKNYSPDRLIEGIKFPGGFNYAALSIASACKETDTVCLIYTRGRDENSY
ncbi:MAG: hypothetical protein WC979_03175 [Candidatus Pacearchaeota archaeon]|jgi:hypothetical protein|nr:hypothetical protein [Clostridia bacterium]